MLRETLVGLLAAWAAISEPAAVIARSGAVTITLPSDLLAAPAVKEQLTSGLTTVFIVTAAAGSTGRASRGAARISIRFELWEERYVVNVADAAGQRRDLTFASDAELGKWWGSNPLIVVAPAALAKSADVDIRLRMLPFSAREETDAQRWLSTTLSSVPGAPLETGERSASILRSLVETSVRRRPLIERHWSVRARRE